MDSQKLPPETEKTENKQPIKDTDTDKKRHARGWKIKIFSRRILLLK